MKRLASVGDGGDRSLTTLVGEQREMMILSVALRCLLSFGLKLLYLGIYPRETLCICAKIYMLRDYSLLHLCNSTKLEKRSLSINGTS